MTSSVIKCYYIHFSPSISSRSHFLGYLCHKIYGSFYNIDRWPRIRKHYKQEGISTVLKQWSFILMKSHRQKLKSPNVDKRSKGIIVMKNPAWFPWFRDKSFAIGPIIICFIIIIAKSTIPILNKRMPSFLACTETASKIDTSYIYTLIKQVAPF